MENKKLSNLDIEQEYNQYVEQKIPKPAYLKNILWAFSVGGSICVLGQLLINFFKSMGFHQEDASTAAVIVLVFMGAFFTGIGVYDELGKRAGAGSIVPITGFANSIVSSAMEYKREGFVLGVAAKMFSIAGPVLVYGFGTSVLVGLIYFFLFR